MNYSFDSPINRKGSNCVKYDLNTSIFGTEDLLPMWVADMDFKTSPAITSALENLSKRGVFGYTFRSDNYHQAIINWTKDSHQWAIQPEWINFSPGVVPGIIFIIQCLSIQTDAILIQTPVYPMFAKSIELCKRNVLCNPLIKMGNSYQIDFDDLEKKMALRPKIFLLCNPHNPNGRVFSEVELSKMAEIALKYDVLIFSDEIHCDLLRPGKKHIPIASLSDEIAQNSVTAIAASKSFNITGLSTASLIIPNKKTKQIYKNHFSQFHIDQGNAFGNLATEIAYTKGKEWLNELNIYLDKNHEFLSTYLNENLPEITLSKAESTFLSWLDFTQLNLSDQELHQFLIHRCKLGLNPGIDFGQNGTGHMRMNIGCPIKLLKQALDQLKEGVQRL